LNRLKSALHLNSAFQEIRFLFVFDSAGFIIFYVKILQAMSYLKTAGQLFWHNYCRCCKTLIHNEDEYFCADCWGQLGLCMADSFCTRCGREHSAFDKVHQWCPKCEDEVFHFDAIACAGIYKPPLSDLIVRFKLSDHTELLPILADFANKAISRASFHSRIDYIVPVPIHWRSRFRRGFNHSQLIAKGVKMGEAVLNEDLVKIKSTKSQTELSYSQRAKNVSGVFAVRQRHDFEGKNVCLIDDVKTSGATLNECAKVLKEAGADRVFAFAIAVAGQEKN